MASTKIAWIGFAGLVVAAAITGIFNSVHTSTPNRTNFSGEVRNSMGGPVSGARILAAEGQQTPQSAYSDENGVFHIVLTEPVDSLKLNVTAAGYVPLNRDANPHRTGPEEFVLQPIPVQAAPPPKAKPRNGPTTRGPNSPIVQGNGNNLSLH